MSQNIFKPIDNDDPLYDSMGIEISDLNLSPEIVKEIMAHVESKKEDLEQKGLSAKEANSLIKTRIMLGEEKDLEGTEKTKAINDAISEALGAYLQDPELLRKEVAQWESNQSAEPSAEEKEKTIRLEKTLKALEILSAKSGDDSFPESDATYNDFINLIKKDSKLMKELMASLDGIDRVASSKTTVESIAEKLSAVLMMLKMQKPEITKVLGKSINEIFKETLIDKDFNQQEVDIIKKNITKAYKQNKKMQSPLEFHRILSSIVDAAVKSKERINGNLKEFETVIEDELVEALSN